GRHTRWPRDWSSDVCSSDLRSRERRAAGAHGNGDDRLTTRPGRLAVCTAGPVREYRLVRDHHGSDEIREANGNGLFELRSVVDQIGRASCRERVEGWEVEGD